MAKISEEMKKMIDVINKNNKKLSENIKGYIAPDIPEKVIKKLVANFDHYLPIKGLVAYYDTSLFNQCSSGLIFTNDGLYYKSFGKPIYIGYADIAFTKIENNSVTIVTLVGKESAKTFNIPINMPAKTLEKVIAELTVIDNKYGQTIKKSVGTVKKMDLPKDTMLKCNEIIHAASIASGGVGAGLAQIPASDNAVIVPIQIGMIVALGAVFEMDITESVAKSLIASFGASIAGRTAVQFLVGWIPGAGNAINTATAAGLTEAIGWMAVKNFYDRWMQDKTKGRYEAMKEGYHQASKEYEQKLNKQADEFLKQKKSLKKNVKEYEELIKDYEEYIVELEKDKENLEELLAAEKTLHELKNLKYEVSTHVS